MGTLSLRKNVGTLLEAYARLRDAGRRCAAAGAGRTSHAGVGALGSALRAAAAEGSRRRSPATWTRAERIELYADARDAGAAVVRGRLRPAGARSHGVRRAGGGVVARIAARSGGRRGDAGRSGRCGRVCARDAARCSTGDRARRRSSAALAQAAHYSWAACAGGGAARLSHRRSRSMRVAVDARELCGRPTGVGRYLAGLLDAWSTSDAARRHQWTLVAHAPLEAPARWTAARRASSTAAAAPVGAVRAAARARAPSGPMCSSHRGTLHP